MKREAMIVRRGITLHVVERETETLPFVGSLLRRWMELGFEPRACRRALEEVIREPASGASESLLDPRAVTDGGLVATDALLYPPSELALSIRFFDARPWSVKAGFDESSAGEVAALLRRLTGDADAVADPSWLPARALAELTRPEPDAPPEFPRIEEPGIYRREHGCVVIRSRTTALMLDPVAFWMPHALRAPVAMDGHVDAIFITHGHADHFNVASILAYAKDSETPVVVPPVPRASLLAPNDMLTTLRMFGQKALAPDWGSSLVFGDIRVDVLPFFGEQPVREGEGPHPDLRNWGSCYRFTTPEFTAVALIDSGVDPLGDMADVVRASGEENGPADFVLSSLPRFHSPFFFGLPQYYLTLPFARLRGLFDQFVEGRLPSVTPGPDGIVDVCRAGGPRYYLPYGNGFEGLGRPIEDVGMQIGEPAEAEVVRYLADRFACEGVPTKPIAWNPGDRVSLRGGRAVRVACSPAA
ncbi:MAG TPA: MBL fold metallo-hydrolase [Pyrinomonadaceae bacterium]